MHYQHLKKTAKWLILAMACNVSAFSQTPPATPPARAAKPDATIIAGIPVNYDESKVGDYTLPDILTTKSGKKISDKQTWLKDRRPEVVKLFETYQFGKVPPPVKLKYDVFDKGTPVFEGKAVRKQVTVYLTPNDTANHKMEIVMYFPANTTKPMPLVLQISFAPNASTITGDATVKLGYTWSQTGQKTPTKRGGPSFGGLDVMRIINEGFAVANIYYCDIEPDFKNGYKYGIRGAYLKPGQAMPADDEWGAISAWSWGLSRAMDYFETDKQVDAKRVAIHGVSRLAKTVLWTGGRDPRFKMVIESCAGEGGGAISRRNFGENIAHMTDTTRYYYQFAPNWHKYAHDFNASPVDAHMLVSLMAGRYLLMQTGTTDLWSDPHGEFLAAQAAQPVFNLFGEQGPGTAPWPAGNDASLAYNPLGYYMHVGGHGSTRADRTNDWDIYLNYMKKFL